MKSIVATICAAVLLSFALLTGCTMQITSNQQTPAPTAVPAATQTNAQPTADETAAEANLVVTLVEDFGKQLKSVSLLAPAETAAQNMRELYAPYVSDELLQTWCENPQSALGRQTSSPWPDRIEISVVQKSADGVYSISGNVVEITSTDDKASLSPISLRVKKIGGEWRIVEVTMSQAQQEIQNPQDDVRYENAKYGLLFDLPETWRGFSVVEEKWEGIAVDGKEAGKVVETGPKLSIRHPAWTKENPRQDIPILVFTPKQWDAVQKEALSVSAAPIPPSELGHNASYVFALPARYNFAYLTGFEEVEQIIKSNPIREITIIEENKDVKLGC